MNKENKKENKFNFVSLEEIEELEEMKEDFISENNDDKIDETKDGIEIEDFSVEDKIEEIPSENEIKEDDKQQEEDVIFESINEERNDSKEEIEIEDFSTEVKVEEPPLAKEEDSFLEKREDSLKKVENNKKEESIKKAYYGFEARVLTYIIVILVVFLAGCYFALEAINFGKKRIVTYNEESTISYKVCNSNGNCTANSDVVNAEDLDRISVLFNYSKEYSENVDYNFNYKIVAMTKVYDPVQTDKIVYSKDDILVDNVKVKGNDNKNYIMSNIDIIYDKYNQQALNYMGQFAPKAKAELDVSLYITKKDAIEKAATLTMPLNQKEFNITKILILNRDKSYSVPIKTWNNYNSVCAFIATIFVLLSLFLLYKLVRLVLKVTTNRNKYQVYLNEILREYDRIIVVARDGYESNEEKEEVKVSTFDDLLDTRDILQKPIVYSKVNSVKSDFIVEDDKKIYKYTLKEADFTDRGD